MHTKSDYDIEVLKILLKENVDRFGDKKRYLHPKTVDNFLTHFYSLKDRRKKELVYNNLYGFLKIVSDFQYDELDSKQSAELFSQFIYPICNFFDIYVGFSVDVKWYFFAAIAIVLFLASILIEGAVVYKIGAFLILGVVFFSRLHKRRVKKVYGIFY